jgi:oligopeptide transport system substrate-binding protein
MKKIASLVVVFALMVALVACDDSGDDSVAVLNWNIGADPLTLDPSLNGASDGGDVINNTFEGLVREVDGVVSPGIAESWSTSDDGLTVTFNLRESKWSDGTDLTANDFLYTFRRAMDPATASEYSWIWEYTNVEGAIDFVYADTSAEDYDADALWAGVGVSAPDDYTLEFELINPTSYFVSLMAFYHFMPVNEAVVEASIAADADGLDTGAWAKDPDVYVSNGPFVLDSYTVGDGLVLVKNENYWDADSVKLDKINGEFIDNESTAYSAYQSDELDFIPSVPASEVNRLIAEDSEFHVYALLGTYYYSFNFDHEDGLFDNVNLRKALSYAIDRDSIVETLGGGQIAATGFVPVGFLDDEGNDFATEAGDYGIATDDSNFDEAVTLFATAASEMGMTVAELQTALEDSEILYNTSDSHALVAQLVQQSFKDVLGFEMSLANQEWAVFQETRKDKDFDIARGGWLTDFMDPSGLLAIFATDNAYNDPNYTNAAYDTALGEALATTDLETHFDKLYEAEQIFMDDMPIIPVYYYSDYVYAKEYVQDWGRSVLGSIDFKYASIEK